MEFYADASSILVSLYEVIYLTLNFIDYFYAYHSLSKDIFFFKDVEEDYNYNISQKTKEIQNLISLIDYEGKKIKVDSIESVESGSKVHKNFEINNNHNEIKINKTRHIHKENEGKTSSKLLISKILKHQKDNDYEYISREKHKSSSRQLANDKTIKGKNGHNTDILNIKLNAKPELCFNNSINSNKETNKISPSSKKNDYEIVKNSFNIFEIIITQFFRCCMSQRMNIKNDVNENANEIINKKLDIINYFLI